MKRKIFRQLLTFSMATLIFCGTILFITVQSKFNKHIEVTTAQQTETLANQLNVLGDKQISYLQNFALNSMRICLISSDDEILFDNQQVKSNSEIKPLSEYANAQLSATADVKIHSSSHEITFYCCKTLENGSTLFVSQTIVGSLKSFTDYIWIILLTVAIIIAMCIYASKHITKETISLVNTIDVKNPIDTNVFDELTPLLKKMDLQNKEIEKQIRAVRHKKHELSDIMSNINESIIVIDNDGIVLSINDAALKMLSKNKTDCIGKFILAVDRNSVFQEILNKMKEMSQFQVDFLQNDRIYRVAVSSTRSSGSILIFLDVTERRAAQKMRMEFSANVSHELKTPLQTISGYAELMSKNMVDSENQAVFSNYIYQESKRMSNLIQDIINLSFLDEQSNFVKNANIDVYEISKRVQNELAPKCENRNIEFFVEGDHSVIAGIERLIHECIFNLSDNAINYNKENGSVTLKIEDCPSCTVLSVIDTGIGIPLSEQDRIFERFYRVDKSRSRSTGGTGLGLSIVKHVATLHDAIITLQSTVGVGTTITINIPKLELSSAEIEN